METTITVKGILQILKNTWWKILVVTVAVALLAGLGTHFFSKPTYASTTHFYIVNVDQNIDYANANTLMANEYLAKNYIEIIKGDQVLQHVSDKLLEEESIELSPKEIRSMISTSTADTLATFALTITDTDPTRAYKVAKMLTDEAPAIVTRISKPYEISVNVPVTSTINELADALLAVDKVAYAELAEDLMEIYNTDQKKLQNYKATIEGFYNRDDMTCITPLRQPVENPNPTSPNIVRNVLLAGILAAIATFAVFFILDFFSTTIHTEDDIKRMTELPVLGSIPEWHPNTQRGNAKKS